MYVLLRDFFCPHEIKTKKLVIVIKGVITCFRQVVVVGRKCVVYEMKIGMEEFHVSHPNVVVKHVILLQCNNKFLLPACLLALKN